MWKYKHLCIACMHAHFCYDSCKQYHPCNHDVEEPHGKHRQGSAVLRHKLTHVAHGSTCGPEGATADGKKFEIRHPPYSWIPSHLDPSPLEDHVSKSGND